MDDDDDDDDYDVDSDENWDGGEVPVLITIVIVIDNTTCIAASMLAFYTVPNCLCLGLTETSACIPCITSTAILGSAKWHAGSATSRTRPHGSM